MVRTATITGTSQTVTLGTLADGVWTITATATNASSVTSAASSVLIVAIDTAPPVISVSTAGTGTSSRHTPSSDETATARYRNNVTSAFCTTNANTSGWTVYTTGSLAAHNTNGLCIIYTDTAGNKAVRHITNPAVDYTPVAPVAPRSITLSSPSSSTGSDATPTFTVTVGETGGAVTLYADRSCANALSAAISVTDTSSPYTVSVTASTLTTQKRYTVYAKHTKDGLASGCSSASASYTLYIPTPTTTTTTSTSTRGGSNTSSSTTSRSRSRGGGGGGGGALVVRDTTPSVNRTIVISQTPSCSTQFTRNLTIGSRGKDVRALQIFLNTAGYTIVAVGPGSPGAETDYFGARTRQALSVYQRNNAITPASGYFGLRTRTLLQRRCQASSGAPATAPLDAPALALRPSACTGNPTAIALIPTYTRGTTNGIIQLFQRALNEKGYRVSQTGPGSPGNEVTVFGPATERAVRAFQTAQGLPVTGTLDTATQCALIPNIATNPLTLANILAALRQKLAELIAARGG